MPDRPLYDDPVLRSLDHLSAERWPGSSRNQRVEKAILNAATTPHSRMSMLLAAIVLGAGVVAAGMTGSWRAIMPAPEADAPAARDRLERHSTDLPHDEPDDEFTSSVNEAGN